MPELEPPQIQPDRKNQIRPNRFLDRLNKRTFKKILPTLTIGSILAATTLGSPDQSSAQNQHKTYLPIVPKDPIIERYDWDTSLVNRSVIIVAGDKAGDDCFFVMPLASARFSSISDSSYKFREIEFNASQCIETFEEGQEPQASQTSSNPIPQRVDPRALAAPTKQAQRSSAQTTTNYQNGVEFGVRTYDPAKATVSEAHPFMGVDIGDNQLTACGANIWTNWLAPTGWYEAVREVDPPYFPDNHSCVQKGHIVHHNDIFELPFRACVRGVTLVYDLGLKVDDQSNIYPEYKYRKSGRSCQRLLKSEIIKPFKVVISKPN